MTNVREMDHDGEEWARREKCLWRFIGDRSFEMFRFFLDDFGADVMRKTLPETSWRVFVQLTLTDCWPTFVWTENSSWKFDLALELRSQDKEKSPRSLSKSTLNKLNKQFGEPNAFLPLPHSPHNKRHSREIPQIVLHLICKPSMTWISSRAHETLSCDKRRSEQKT